MVDEMRFIPHPRGIGIANVNGRSLHDGRLPEDLPRLRFGHFKNTVDFHPYLRRGIDSHPDREVKALIDMHQAEWPIWFTHADLSSLNIVVRGDTVVGVVDWETAGWHLFYWEYTSTWHVDPQNMFWRDEVNEFLDPMPKALEMEILRHKYFGEFGL